MPTKIFVGNLNENSSSNELRTLFEKYGEVTECDIIKNFGFVHMEKKSDAESAIDALQGHNLDGYKMNVEISTQSTQGRSRARDQQRGGGGGRGGGRGRGRGGRGGRGRDSDRYEPYGRDNGFSRDRQDYGDRRSIPDRRDPYARDPYSARDRRDPYERDPYPRDPYARDPYARDPYAARDPYSRDPYARDPYARDTYARDPYARDPYARDPYPVREPLPARDPYARPLPEYYDGAAGSALGAREEARSLVRYPEARERLPAAGGNTARSLPQGWSSTADRGATAGLGSIGRLGGSDATSMLKSQGYGAQLEKGWGI